MALWESDSRLPRAWPAPPSGSAARAISLDRPLRHLMTGKTLTLVTRPGIVVDTDGLQLVHSRVKYRQTPANPDTPVTLRVELIGQKAHGRVVVRPARRTFGQWLLRRPTSLSAGD